jgi:hypothetical protein
VQLPTFHGWLLIVSCVALTALFGLACALDEDGSFGVDPCLSQRTSCICDELPGALPPGGDAHWLRAARAASPVLTAPGLRAAVPGGLCLLS